MTSVQKVGMFINLEVNIINALAIKLYAHKTCWKKIILDEKKKPIENIGEFIFGIYEWFYVFIDNWKIYHMYV